MPRTRCSPDARGEQAARALRPAPDVPPTRRAGARAPRGGPHGRLGLADARRVLHLQPPPRDARHAAADARHVDRPGAACDRGRESGSSRSSTSPRRSRIGQVRGPLHRGPGQRLLRGRRPSATSPGGPCSRTSIWRFRPAARLRSSADRLRQDDARCARSALLRRGRGPRARGRRRRARARAALAPP